MTSNKVYWIFLMTIVFSLIVHAATGNPQADLAFANGMNYLMNSPNEIWNATDFTAFAIIAKNFPITYSLVSQTIDSKKKFDLESYPFIASLLKPIPSLPSEFEMGLGTPELLKKLYACETFTPEDFLEFSKKKNTISSPFEASHAVLFLTYIKKQYALNCLKPDQTLLADQTIPLAVAGLTLSPSPEYFDPYLEQECARGIATGIITPDVFQLVLTSQDKINGGWYLQQKKVNADWLDEFSGKIQIGEYPNGHTSMFAMCILSVALVKT